jgi:hypothetical protein
MFGIGMPGMIVIVIMALVFVRPGKLPVHYTMIRENGRDMERLLDALKQIPSVRGVTLQLFYPCGQGKDDLALPPPRGAWRSAWRSASSHPCRLEGLRERPTEGVGYARPRAPACTLRGRAAGDRQSNLPLTAAMDHDLIGPTVVGVAA